MVDQLPPMMPHDLDMERAILGAMICNRDDAMEAVERLTALDFYKGGHRTIFDAARKVFERDQCLDGTLLIAELKKAGQLEEVGGTIGIGEIVGAAPQNTVLAPYLAAVREHSLKRQLIAAATECLRGGMDGKTSADVAGEFATALARVEEKMAGGHSEDTSIAAVMEEIFASAEQEKPRGLLTGMENFDRIAGGFMPGNLILVAARPGTGKTTLAVQWLREWGLAGTCSYIASYEMEKVELGEKMASALSGVPLYKNGQPKERPDEYYKACGRVSKLGIYIEAPTDRTLLRLRLAARRHARLKQNPAEAIVLDYIQQVRGDAQADNREQEVASVSRELKALARELKVPVIACCQLNRAIATGQEPSLVNLRESGALEQDADMVIFIHDLEPTNVAPTHRVKIKVAKNRRGGTGSCYADFRRDTGVFDDSVDQLPRNEVQAKPTEEARWHE